MRMTKLIVVFCLFSFSSVALSSNADHYAYYSVHQDPQLQARVPVTSTGQPDFSNVENLGYVTGFENHYDLNDPNNQCRLLGKPPAPGYWCGNSPPELDEQNREILTLGLNSGVIEQGGNRIRMFFPPGTRGATVTMHYPQGRGEVKVAYRLAQPIGGGDLQPFQAGEGGAYEAAWALKDTNAYLLHTTNSSTNFAQLARRDDWSNQPPPSEEGVWAYFDFPCFSSAQAFTLTRLIVIAIYVEREAYESWYNNVGTEGSDWEWDAFGDPLPKQGIVQDYVPPISCADVSGVVPPVYEGSAPPVVTPQPAPNDPPQDPAQDPTSDDDQPAGELAVYNNATGEFYLPAVVVVDDENATLEDLRDISVDLTNGDEPVVEGAVYSKVKADFNEDEVVVEQYCREGEENEEVCVQPN